MRQAVIDLLRSTPAVTDIVAGRVYGRQGLLGGVSRDQTPEAFTPDGAVQPSIVVVLESRVTREARDGIDEVSATQTIQVWAVGHSYPPVKQALRAARAVLHQTARRGVRIHPVDETTVRWTDTRWTSTSPELYDEALRAPTMFMRFDATVTEPL